MFFLTAQFKDIWLTDPFRGIIVHSGNWVYLKFMQVRDVWKTLQTDESQLHYLSH